MDSSHSTAYLRREHALCMLTFSKSSSLREDSLAQPGLFQHFVLALYVKNNNLSASNLQNKMPFNVLRGVSFYWDLA